MKGVLGYLLRISTLDPQSMSMLAFALRSGTQRQSNKLQLVNFVCEGENESFVEREPLRRALRVIEEFDQRVSQLMPKFPLPEIFEGDEKML